MANRRPLRGAFLIPPPQGAVADFPFHHLSLIGMLKASRTPKSAFHDRVATEYPQCRKQLRHSSGLKCSRQVPRNGQSVSLLRRRAVRTRALSFAKQSSMGLRSGL